MTCDSFVWHGSQRFQCVRRSGHDGEHGYSEHSYDPTEAEDHGKSSIRRDDKALIRQAEEMDDVSDERRIWLAAREDRASIRFMFGDSPLARKG